MGAARSPVILRAASAVGKAYRVHRRGLPADLQKGMRDLLSLFAPYIQPDACFTTSSDSRVVRGDLKDQLQLLVSLASRSARPHAGRLDVDHRHYHSRLTLEAAVQTSECGIDDRSEGHQEDHPDARVEDHAEVSAVVNNDHHPEVSAEVDNDNHPNDHKVERSDGRVVGRPQVSAEVFAALPASREVMHPPVSGGVAFTVGQRVHCSLHDCSGSVLRVGFGQFKGSYRVRFDDMGEVWVCSRLGSLRCEPPG